MIKKALTEICSISNDAMINSENYVLALDFIDNLYHITHELKKYIGVKQIKFLPSFKAQSICDRIGLEYSELEATMRLIKVQSELFLGDIELTNNILTDTVLKSYCESITRVDNVIIFKLL